MSKKFFVSFILLFFVSIGVFFTVMDMMEAKKKVKIESIKPKKVKKYSYRKYLHVKNFYESIAKQSVEIGLKYNVPPAALLAIAGVESGYGRGYVAKITGNILSLGAARGEPELPALYLPNLKKDSSKILYSKEKIDNFDKMEVEWKKRPASLKKDYRPEGIAGSSKKLDFFDKNLEKKVQANVQCMEDFAKQWISKDKKFKPFVEARVMLDKQVKLHSSDILFDEKLNEDFIKMISGKKNSFNYRKTWAPKVILIMKKTGLVELVKSLHVSDKNFKEIWKTSS
ncbi:glucosaminidase domain-containing protein [Sulfurospirillum arcachonense]|uniref:glucosaminidase domain-containing protein n=1 Tax=Sulfurospirillum arcachonense TaxID=57666 RepID=UPI000468E57F|nr:glucosaminidase domain-containing protein [Sulfurospirillum arcachonense]